MELMDFTKMYLIPVLAGLMLSAATGLRMFLPLAIVSWAARLDWIELHAALSWLDSYPAAGTFTAAVIFEVLADKIPAVDHVVDTFATFVKPVAAALGMMALLVEFDPLWAVVIGIAAGSTTALGIHSVKSGGRLAANLGTFGFAAPILSLLEDILAFVLILIAVFLPIAAILGLGALVWFFFLRKRAAEPA